MSVEEFITRINEQLETLKKGYQKWNHLEEPAANSFTFTLPEKEEESAGF
ncbi:hypothetical protein [Bacillus piscicola]|nr:hypothetical protein [Bacillus piscicola]